MRQNKPAQVRLAKHRPSKSQTNQSKTAVRTIKSKAKKADANKENVDLKAEVINKEAELADLQERGLAKL